MTPALLDVLHVSAVFLKVGFVFFGGGFLLIPVLHRELVEGLAWLTPHQFVDGVALSQLTPGPVAILATFCGYQRAGVPGAIAATFFVFLPAFVLMSAMTGFYARTRELPAVQAVMKALPPVVVGLIFATALELGRPLASKPVPIVVTAAALFLLVRFRVPPAILIAGGALTGLAVHMHG